MTQVRLQADDSSMQIVFRCFYLRMVFFYTVGWKCRRSTDVSRSTVRVRACVYPRKEIVQQEERNEEKAHCCTVMDGVELAFDISCVSNITLLLGLSSQTYGKIYFLHFPHYCWIPPWCLLAACVIYTALSRVSRPRGEK